MNLFERVKDDFKTDVTWNRAVRLGSKGAHALPRTSLHYALEKFPIIGWLPRYDPRWLFNDIIAGLTLGLMLIPQGLSYAKIASIPVQYGLMSSWFPSAVYCVMGTSKDISVGPTSLIGLMTAEAVAKYRDEYSPVEIASAVALMMGVYGMVVGFLKLGFLLEFISLPILSGFISAVAITIVLNQMGSLLGSTVEGTTAHQIYDTFHNLPQANGYACAVGFTGIAFLAAADQAYRRWNKSTILWLLSITRAFLCLVLFTGVSYAVNRNRGGPDNYLFGLVELHSKGQVPPRFPDKGLIGKVAARSVAVFVGSAVEHTAIARGFAAKNNYVIGQSQELSAYGVINFFNSFFSAMGVGGAMSRTAVNSSCNVKTPLSGLVTTAVVLVAIFKLSDALYWIPKATLAAIIICAVWPLISPPYVFYRYWKSSLADFISCMIAFWLSLFDTTYLGIGCAVAFNIAYLLLLQVFARVRSAGPEAQQADACGPPVPAGTLVFRLPPTLFFANAHAACAAVLHAAERQGSPLPAGATELRVAVLDLAGTTHVDTTAVTHLHALEAGLRARGVELRLAGMTGAVQERFRRMRWPAGEDAEGSLSTRVFPDVASAMAATGGAVVVLEGVRVEKGGSEGERGNASSSWAEVGGGSG